MKMPSLLKSISRVGLAVSLAGTVLLSAPTTKAADSASATPSDSLNEVIVTAQRREQRLQDVGISVTAMGAEDLKALNIENASDIARAVPSLKLNAFSSSAVVWNIRGVSQNDYGDQQEPPVAVYQDDSYSSSINTASFPTFDLARIEVLRGPQGTLFGRNATGGAIQFISNKPTKTLDGYASLSVGSNNQRIYEGAISGPLSDNVQARFSAIRDTDDGFITDVTPGSQKFGGANHYALRGIIEWQPAEGTNVGLTLRYMRAPNERQAGGYVFQPACPNDNYQGAVLPANQGCGFWGSNPLSSGSNYRNDAININLGANPWTTAAGDKAGLYALDHHRHRLTQDHEKATLLANTLSPLSYVAEILPVETNIVIFRLSEGVTPERLLAYLSDHQVRAASIGKQLMRMVFHLDVTHSQFDRLLGIVRAFR